MNNRITERDLQQAIININHNSENMKECLIAQGEQHKAMLEEMKDQKAELIFLRKDTNKIILWALMIVGALVGLTKFLNL